MISELDSRSRGLGSRPGRVVALYLGNHDIGHETRDYISRDREES